MKKLLLSAVVVTTSLISFAQPTLEKIWESDTVNVRNPESVLFDAKSNTLYVSNMNLGSVAQLDLDGKPVKKDVVTGLNSNKGSAIYNDLYYTAEQKAVAVIDLKKGTIVRRIPIDSAVMLNDLAIDSKGIIYVSDTRTGKVFRIEGDKPMLYLENLPGANGLLTINSDLYVLTSTAVQKFDSNKKVTKIADDFESGLDGIVPISPTEFIISNYKGILYYLKTDGTKQILLDTRGQNIMSNDIGYNPKTKTLFAPSFSTNRIIAYKVK